MKWCPIVEKGCKAAGRPGYEREKLLKVLLFAFMEQGYPSLREIEKLCKVDIRFMWLRDEMKAPSYATLCDFINQELSCSLEEIVQEINSCIFGQEHVDLDHVYKAFIFLRTEPVKGNQYGRTVELHQCEDCSGCPHRSKCHKSRFDRIIRLNYELTSIHKEVLDNLNSIHGALLRMNRSIQSEGTYGEIKANRGYERFRRRGINKAILEIALISCGFNLHKYHLSKLAKANPAKAAG